VTIAEYFGIKGNYSALLYKVPITQSMKVRVFPVAGELCDSNQWDYWVLKTTQMYKSFADSQTM